MSKKIVIFPNDPIIDYYRKGEIKPRYYNPGNFFNEVHIISLAEKDIDSSQVKDIAGSADLFIYPVGNPLTIKGILSLPIFISNVFKIVKKIDPQVLRAYNSIFGGFLATFTGKQLRIPSVVSLHIDQDEIRKFEKPSSFKAVIYRYFSKFLLEPFSMRNADVVIPVSNFLSTYAKKYGAKNIKVIYNKVYASQFKKPENFIKSYEGFKILTVGRLSPQKNMQCLLNAVVGLKNTQITFIGTGPDKRELENLADILGIKNRVNFIEKVKNTEIQNSYWDADVFAIASKHEGFCIPVLEAMAAGLPVIVANKQPLPELVDGAGLVVENIPENFRKTFDSLIKDHSLRKKLSEKSEKRALEIDGKIMEKKEIDMYMGVLGEEN